MDEPPDAPRPTVLLRHELPDGTWHMDWMIAQDAEGSRPLTTFRAPGRIDDLADGATMALERLDDHRPAYLTWEGELCGNRGSVRRVARGRVVAWTGSADDERLQILWEHDAAPARPQTLRLRLRGRTGPSVSVLRAGDPG